MPKEELLREKLRGHIKICNLDVVSVAVIFHGRQLAYTTVVVVVSVVVKINSVEIRVGPCDEINL